MLRSLTSIHPLIRSFVRALIRPRLIRPQHLIQPASVDYPSLAEAIVFRVKATGLQLRRAFVDRFVQPVQRYDPIPKVTVTSIGTGVDEVILAESSTPLWTSHEAIERNLILGKIHNLRLATQQMNGIELPAHGLFSFWAQVGQPIASRGYVKGRELRQGCVIPSIAGGLCQLSNALYSVALDAGLEIVERHAHSKIIPGSLAEIGRDATVFWNYVDLRFRTSQPLRVEAFLTTDSLVVRLKGQKIKPESSIATPSEFRSTVKHEKTCQTCGVTSCFRSAKKPIDLNLERVAYLLDEYWSEYDEYIQTHRQETDILSIPLDGKQWHKANYAWNSSGFAAVHQAQWLTLRRSIAARSLPAQGQSRQQLLFQSDERLAEWYAARLSYDVTHVVMMQNLLPFLWNSGDLGGRTFDVLMTRLPLFALQARLDHAAQCHPESSTLADFRGDRTLVEAERQALAVARYIITPHREIAALFPEKAILLPWHIPQVSQRSTAGDAAPNNNGNRILFPASTLGRKGAYELREVAQNLGLTLKIWGSELEGAHFWQGVAIERPSGDPLADPLTDVDLVVLPAYVEHRPRVLLQAIARGIPVIASEACGLAGLPGVTTIPVGDVAALQTAIEHYLIEK